MIVSPPKAGKTTLLKEIALSVQKTEPDMHMIILLIADIPALSVLNTVLIWVALILTVVSLIDYLVKNKNVLSMQN